MATVFCCDNSQNIYKNNAFMETNGNYFLLVSHISWSTSIAGS